MSLQLHPDNPRRLTWNGRAVFPLGATEHYGAILNAAFDYERYLDTVAADRLSLTRVFGFFRELPSSLGGQLGHANTLAPVPAQYLAPWARVPHGAPGADGLPRFDLERWDERYWSRLRDFVAAAGRRDVVVELTLFCNQYGDELWQQSPLHPANNANGVGAHAAGFRDFLSLRDPSLVEHQIRYARKAAEELREADNVVIEVCNEPVGHDPLTVRSWQDRILDALPRRHLVAVNPHANLPVCGDVRRLDDGLYQDDPRIDLVNVHYISQREPRAGLSCLFPPRATQAPDSYRFGSIASFVALRPGKPVCFDEDFTGVVHGVPVQPWQSRMEAWESFLGGCAAYDHLDFSFTTDDPTGSAAGHIPHGLPREWFDGRALRRHLSYLADYATSLDLAALKPDPTAAMLLPEHVGAVAARAGSALAVYLADVRPFDQGFGSTPLSGETWLGGLAPADSYVVRALDTCTGRWQDLLPLLETDLRGDLCVAFPAFEQDLLLHLEPVR